MQFLCSVIDEERLSSKHFISKFCGCLFYIQYTLCISIIKFVYNFLYNIICIQFLYNVIDEERLSSTHTLFQNSLESLSIDNV